MSTGQVPAGAQQAVVRAIIDGDTIEVAARAPGPALRSTGGVRVRLLEIDTPETHKPNTPVQCYGPQATDALRRLIPVGSTVRVEPDVERRDRYGRYLLYVWDARGLFVNLEMVRRGYAQAKLYPPNDRYWQQISAAGRQAKAARRGVWGACPYFGAPRALGGVSRPPAVAAPRAPVAPPSQAPQPGGAYYASCAAAKADGVAPLHRGDPGYRAGLDRDGDGVACES